MSVLFACPACDPQQRGWRRRELRVMMASRTCLRGVLGCLRVSQSSSISEPRSLFGLRITPAPFSLRPRPLSVNEYEPRRRPRPNERGSNSSRPPVAIHPSILLTAAALWTLHCGCHGLAEHIYHVRRTTGTMGECRSTLFLKACQHLDISNKPAQSTVGMEPPLFVVLSARYTRHAAWTRTFNTMKCHRPVP